ncbi:hypothetical protein Sste5346_006679 [Sporothrix stenoceras]|uniref:Beta-lactamase-related domain-containing protein n=1 Tax=Sporothrix stenoceras TaxID=5173 RepID=A0ABR3Z0E0_9PEZI
MDNFERQLAKATDPATRELVGALAIVVDDEGKVLYQHAAGRQSLAEDAPPLDPDSTVSLGSAGKIITHIAALQLVERGVLNLDESVIKYLPELGRCLLMTGFDEDDLRTPLFRRPASPITLRHLLLHTSGLSDHDAVDARFGWDAADRATAGVFDHDAHPIAQRFAIPLIFDPGEGFAYGYSIHWTQLLVTRVCEGNSFVKHVQDNIFDPLGMASSSYVPRKAEDLWARRLQMVERRSKREIQRAEAEAKARVESAAAAADGGEKIKRNSWGNPIGDAVEEEEEEAEEGTVLVDAEDQQQGLMCSMSDMGRFLSALLSSSPLLLKDKASYDLLLAGQFAPGSTTLKDLRGEQDNYKFVTGATYSRKEPPPAVNWSMGGLVVEDEPLPVSALPPGTVTWEGMPNVMWAVNREKKRAAFFATQLVPVGDLEANNAALSFIHDAWTTFG